MLPFTKRKTILIVDDEPVLQELYREILKAEEWDVKCVSSGEDAMTSLKDNKDCNLLIIDMKMPGMDGKALYSKIKAIFPHLTEKIVFATGDLSDETVSFLKETNLEYISKPFAIDNVKDVVKKALQDR